MSLYEVKQISKDEAHKLLSSIGDSDCYRSQYSPLGLFYVYEDKVYVAIIIVPAMLLQKNLIRLSHV